MIHIAGRYRKILFFRTKNWMFDHLNKFSKVGLAENISALHRMLTIKIASVLIFEVFIKIKNSKLIKMFD